MCMDSSDDEEDVAPVAAAPKPVAAPVESVPAPIKEKSPLIEAVTIGKCVPVTEVAPVPLKVEDLSAAPPALVLAPVTSEKEVFGDVLDIMDVGGMTMDSDSDDNDASEETTSFGDISDMSTESLKEVEEVPKVPAPDIKNPAAEAV